MRNNSGKHTTHPRGWLMSGNRNSHKQRSIPSRFRTLGRACRYARRAMAKAGYLIPSNLVNADAYLKSAMGATRADLTLQVRASYSN